MATKGKLDPYSDIQTRQVNTNMSGGQLSLSPFRQGMASARQMGQSVNKIADKITAYGEERQRQVDSENSLTKLEQLNTSYLKVYEEQRDVQSDVPLSERVRNGVIDAKQTFIEENAFTPGERDIFNLSSKKAEATINAQALQLEQSHDRAKRSIAFEDNIEKAAARALHAQNSIFGLSIYDEYKKILDLANYSPDTRKKLNSKLETIALATAQGLLHANPEQLLQDIDNHLYDNKLNTDKISALRRSAATELRRNDSKNGILARHQAEGNKIKVLEGKLPSSLKTPDFSGDRLESYHREIAIYEQGSKVSLSLGISSSTEYAKLLLDFSNKRNAADSIDTVFYTDVLKQLQVKEEKFEKDLEKDPVNLLRSLDKGLNDSLLPYKPSDPTYMEILRKAQIKQGILSEDVRYLSDDQVNTYANGWQLASKDINVKALRNHGGSEPARQVLLQMHKEWGNNYSVIIGEIARHSNKNTLTDIDTISSAFIDNPIAFDLMIKVNMMKEEDWTILGGASWSGKDGKKQTNKEAFQADDLLQSWIEYNSPGLQKNARISGLLEDMANLLGFIHKEEGQKSVDRLKDLLIKDLGHSEIPVRSANGKDRTVWWPRALTDFEENSLQYNLHTPELAKRFGAMDTFPRTDEALTNLFYSNETFPCATENGDGKYNLCSKDPAATGIPFYRLINADGELVTLEFEDFLKPPPVSTFEQTYQMSGRRMGPSEEYLGYALKLLYSMFRRDDDDTAITLDSTIESYENSQTANSVPGLPPVKKEYSNKKILQNESNKIDNIILNTQDLWSLNKYDSNTIENWDKSIVQHLKESDVIKKLSVKKRDTLMGYLDNIRSSMKQGDVNKVHIGLNKLSVELLTIHGQTITDGEVQTPTHPFPHKKQRNKKKVRKAPWEKPVRQDPGWGDLDEFSQVEPKAELKPGRTALKETPTVKPRSIPKYNPANLAKDLKRFRGLDNVPVDPRVIKLLEKTITDQNKQSLIESGEVSEDEKGITYAYDEQIKRLKQLQDEMNIRKLPQG